MQVILFEIPLLELPIRGFGVMAMLSFIVGLSLVIWRARKKNLPSPFIMDLGIVCLMSGILGARIFFVLENFNNYNWSLFHVWDGGFSISGAILGIVLPFLVYFGWRSLMDLDRNATSESADINAGERDQNQRNAASEGEDSTRLYWLIGLGILSALILSRVLYVYMHPDSYRITISDRVVYPFDFIKIWQGGIVFYGGLFGGIIGGVSFIKWYGYSVLKTSDVFAAPLLLAQSIARWGCFLVGDDFGTRVSESFPLAVRFPADAMITKYQKNAGIIEPGAELSTWVHPAQLYMSAGVFVCFLLLLGIEYAGRKFSRSETPFPGWSFGWMLILYSIHRFIVEFFRGDPVTTFSFSPIPALMKTFGLPPVHAGLMEPTHALRISQLISVLLLVGAVVFMILCWWYHRPRKYT